MAIPPPPPPTRTPIPPFWLDGRVEGEYAEGVAGECFVEDVDHVAGRVDNPYGEDGFCLHEVEVGEVEGGEVEGAHGAYALFVQRCLELALHLSPRSFLRDPFPQRHIEGF